MIISSKFDKLLYNYNKDIYALLYRYHRRLRKFYESERQKHRKERRTAEYLLISPTNCGRTWLRVMIGRILQQTYQIKGDINLHHLYSFSEVNPHIPSIKAIHERYKQFGEGYQSHKIIFLARDPRDALISSYRRQEREKDSQNQYSSLSDYICRGNELTQYYIQFYNDWGKHKDQAQDFLLVRYEDMREDTALVLRNIMNFLNIDVEEEVIEEAVNYASLENMRKMEREGNSQVRAKVLLKRDPNNPDSFKVGKGKVGGYKEKLSSEEKELVDNIISEQLDPSYGYI